MVDRQAASSRRRLHYRVAERRRWMRVLAHSSAEQLAGDLQALRPRPDYPVDWLRTEPSGALVVDDSNARRSADVTRCLVRLSTGVTGTACLPGNRPNHAELAAVFDALLKIPEHDDELMASLISPMESMTDVPSGDGRRVIALAVDRGAGQ